MHFGTDLNETHTGNVSSTDVDAEKSATADGVQNLEGVEKASGGTMYDPYYLYHEPEMIDDSTHYIDDGNLDTFNFFGSDDIYSDPSLPPTELHYGEDSGAIDPYQFTMDTTDMVFSDPNHEIVNHENTYDPNAG